MSMIDVTPDGPSGVFGNEICAPKSHWESADFKSGPY
jgi:hypothetical protein